MGCWGEQHLAEWLYNVRLQQLGSHGKTTIMKQEYFLFIKGFSKILIWRVGSFIYPMMPGGGRISFHITRRGGGLEEAKFVSRDKWTAHYFFMINGVLFNAFSCIFFINNQLYSIEAHYWYPNCLEVDILIRSILWNFLEVNTLIRSILWDFLEVNYQIRSKRTKYRYKGSLKGLMRWVLFINPKIDLVHSFNDRMAEF